MLMRCEPEFRRNDMHRDEVLDFVACVRARTRGRNDIGNAVLTSKIMQAVYDSSNTHREIVLER